MLIGGLFAFIVVALVIGGMSGPSHDHYYLDLVNSGDQKATVTVSGVEKPIEVEPHSNKMVTVDKQDKSKSREEREFTIQVGDKKSTAKSLTPYLQHTVVDVNGDSEVAAVDVGPMYGGGSDGKVHLSDIKVVKSFHHPAPVYPVSVWNQDKSEFDVSINWGFGEKLPDKIQVAKGHSGPVSRVRLVVVPPDQAEDPAAIARLATE